MLYEVITELEVDVDRCRAQVVHAELARHAGPPREDGGHAEDLVEGRGEEAAAAVAPDAEGLGVGDLADQFGPAAGELAVFRAGSYNFV